MTFSPAFIAITNVYQKQLKQSCIYCHNKCVSKTVKAAREKIMLKIQGSTTAQLKQTTISMVTS